MELIKNMDKKISWCFGANFIPSNAINHLEMWQEETFSPDIIDSELGWAEGIGMTLMRGETVVKIICDDDGYFLDFPGFAEGPWMKEAQYPLEGRIRFIVRYGRFTDGLLTFYWEFQPDGRYYADEDDFGWEDDEEITLVSRMDKQGNFIEPFRARGD